MKGIDSSFLRGFSVTLQSIFEEGSCLTGWRAAEGKKARYALIER